MFLYENCLQFIKFSAPTYKYVNACVCVRALECLLNHFILNT